MDWMAEKLCVPKQRVQNHLATFRFDTISAIYYIMQDTLVKEVLYPPHENMKNSFIFRLNNRQRTSTYGTYEYYDDDSPSRARLYEAPASRGFEANPASHTLETFQLPSSRMRQKEDRGLLPKARENNTRNVVDIRNRVGDGDHLGRRSNLKSSLLKSNHAFSKQELFPKHHVVMKDALKCSEPLRDQSSTFEPKPFKSYKNSRPVKTEDLSRNITAKASNEQCKVSEEKRHHPVDASENSDHASKSSVNLNYQRNLKLLNEKYGLKSRELSKSTKPDNEAGVQLTREWKRKPLHGKGDPNGTSIKSNGIRDYRASTNTNGRVNPTDGNVIIRKPELVSKDSYHHQTNKLTAGSKAREYNESSKITEQIPAGKHCTKYFYSSQKQQHKKRSDRFNRTVDDANARYPNDNGQRNLRSNPLRAHEQKHQYDVLKTKPKKELLDLVRENKKFISK